MNEKNKNIKKTEKKEKQNRLSQALRDNLKRRKEQARKLNGTSDNE